MITFDKTDKFIGELEVPADKSITHRSLIISALTNGVSLIHNPLISADTMTTFHCLEAMGVDIVNEKSRFAVRSDGYKKFKEPKTVLNCLNSGTTARLLAGVLSAQPFYSSLTGDVSLNKRPMSRVIKPLNRLGASIFSREDNAYLPMTILPAKLHGEKLIAETKSAQVKSAIILAGLQIDNSETTYTELVQTRDHTERLLKLFGADISTEGLTARVHGGLQLKQQEVKVPGDFSSAAFHIGLGLIFEGSAITIKNVGLNKTRTGLLDVLKSLGVNIDVHLVGDNYEPFGDIFVKSQSIKGGKIEGDIIANIIDEIPLIAMLGLFAKEAIEIRNAKELRVKESDRIKALITNFTALGADVEEYEDGLKVYPLKSLKKKAVLHSFDDHRIAMINIILAKKFGVDILLDEIEPIEVSYPDFVADILELDSNKS